LSTADWISAKAASVGAKTVNGPSPRKVSTKPAAVTAAARVLQSVVAIATISPVISFSILSSFFSENKFFLNSKLCLNGPQSLTQFYVKVVKFTLALIKK
jgi:hypothetical protein